MTVPMGICGTNHYQFVFVNPWTSTSCQGEGVLSRVSWVSEFEFSNILCENVPIAMFSLEYGDIYGYFDSRVVR